MPPNTPSRRAKIPYTERSPQGKEHSWPRLLKIRIAPYLLKAIIGSIVYSCRVISVVGASHAEKLVKDKQPFLPCYWHQQSLFCAYQLFQLQRRGLKLGFLVSPSDDGEIGARLVESRGALAIRGSASATGAQAMREVLHAVVRDGISITTTADGPRGPCFQLKPGVAMLAKLTGAPVLPMAYAADRAWHLKSWDQFIIPKPFSRVAIAIGEPRHVPLRLTAEDTLAMAHELSGVLNALAQAAHSVLQRSNSKRPSE